LIYLPLRPPLSYKSCGRSLGADRHRLAIRRRSRHRGSQTHMFALSFARP
jgi:hypothetical protein